MMDSFDGSDVKSMNGDVRKVRCPKCRNVLIEPTNIPLYRCGFCSTVLQAKHYKATQSNTPNEGFEGNDSLEKSDSIFSGGENFTGAMVAGEVKHGKSESKTGTDCSESKSEKYFDINETKEENIIAGDLSGEQLQKCSITGTGELENCSTLLECNAEKPPVSDGETAFMESPDGWPEKDVGDSLQKSDQPFSHGQNHESSKIECEGSKYQDFIFSEKFKNSMIERVHLSSETGGSSSTASEFIYSDTNVLSVSSKTDRQIPQTNAIHILTMDPQNLLDVETKEGTSAKEELPEVDGGVVCISQQNIPAEKLSDSHKNMEDIFSSVRVEKNPDVEVDDLDCKKILSASSGAVVLSKSFKADQKMSQTKFTNMNEIYQQNLLGEKIKEMSFSHEQVPELGGKVDCISTQCFPAEKWSDSPDNIKDTFLNEQLEKNFHPPGNDFDSKLDIPASCDSQLAASLNIFSPGNMTNADHDMVLHENSMIIEIPKESPQNEMISESFRSPNQAPWKGSLVVKENHRSYGNKTESSSSGNQMANSSSLASQESENKSLSIADLEPTKSGDCRTSAEMDPFHRGLGEGARELKKSLFTSGQHRHVMSASSLEEQSKSMDAEEQSKHLYQKLVNPRQISKSMDAGGKDFILANKFNSMERRVLQESSQSRTVGNSVLYPSERSLSNTHHLFQRKPSDASEHFHLTQNLIESQREELLRSLSMYSDSRDFDYERMELLNKIEELRQQLIGSCTPSRDVSRNSYIERRTHRSDSIISESEDEYSDISNFSHQFRFRERQYVVEDLPKRTQSPRASPYRMQDTSQQFPPSTPCIHSNCRPCCRICSRLSGGNFSPCKVHSRGSREHVHRRERDNDVMRYCRPILGGAHFVSCYECFQILQIPEDFDFSASRYKQLRCGSCLEILEFSVLGKTQIIPYPQEARDSHQFRVLTNDQEEIPFSNEHLQSGKGSIADEDGDSVHISRVSYARIRRRKRSAVQPPLHSLMGYVSASEIIYQEQD